MAQKTNPIGLRLGSTQVWDLTFQNYGSRSKFYSNFSLKQLTLNNFLQYQFFLSKNNLINKTWLELNNKSFMFKLSCTLTHSTFNRQQFNFFESKIEKVLRSTYRFRPDFEIFHESYPLITASLIASYVNYLHKQKFSLKLITVSLEKFLKSNLNLVKVVFLSNGATTVVLKGFKLKISGRFENTRNRMAKSYEQSYGLLPLIQLKSYVEFYSQPIFTKLGTCTFQVHLFYEIKECKYQEEKRTIKKL